MAAILAMSPTWRSVLIRRQASSFPTIDRSTIRSTCFIVRAGTTEHTGGASIVGWQYFGPTRVAEWKLGNTLIGTFMNNARTHSAIQPGVSDLAWGDQSSDRLGYDGSGRPATKRYLAGGINGTTHAYNDASAIVGFTGLRSLGE